VAEDRSVRVVHVALSLRLTVGADVLRRRVGELAERLGDRLAERVQAAVVHDRIGYFPALDYFAGHDGVETPLLDAARRVASVACDYALDTVPSRLWGIFSSVKLEHVQAMAFTLPRVTPHQPDARTALAAHYSPDTVRLDIVLGIVQKGAPKEGYARAVASRVIWNLRERFEGVAVTDARVVDGQDF
jgi:hypothetical protein